MKTTLLSTTSTAMLAALFSLGSPSPAKASLAQYPNQAYGNDFSSLTDAGWTRLSLFAASTGQTWDASTGAYRMTAIPNGYNPGNGRYGFVGSVVTSLPGFTDGYVQSDVVTWQGNGGFGAWGVGARLNNLFAPLNLTGYAFEYEPYGNTLTGDIRLTRLGPPSIFNSLGAMNLTLTPGLQYTLTLETTGSSIVGSIWNVGQAGVSLVGSVSATDATYAAGSVGLFAVCQEPMPPVDVTFDNFVVMVPEPGSAMLLGLGLAGWLALRRSRV